MQANKVQTFVEALVAKIKQMSIEKYAKTALRQVMVCKIVCRAIVTYHIDSAKGARSSPRKFRRLLLMLA